MELDWALVLSLVAGAGAAALLVWSARSGNRSRLTAAVVACLAGSVSGWLILAAANQSGIASTQGFGLSLVLGAVVLGLVVFGIAAKRHRVTAFVAAALLALSAIAASQLFVALSRG